MKLRYYAITDKGNFRSHNEDSFLAADSLVCGQTHGESETVRILDTEESSGLFALADGLGGHEAGEIASRVALEKLAWMEKAIRPIEELPSSGWKNLIRKINNEVNAYGESIGKPKMGTTLVGCLLGRRKSWIFNVGDSRLYHFTKNGLSKVTVDHNIGEELGSSYGRNLLTSCIGGGTKSIEVDTFDYSGKLSPGDFILICTDGLTEVLNIDQIEKILREHEDLRETCRILSEEANLRLTRDNHTIVIIRIDSV
ncbi:PP2C family protein-serine/threonine phosphatase [Leptospira licerasiae]|uniref:Stage II sporulation protein E n=1 Tax=Leptospira licerasiae str. MMD4847 TaxID=1049971 RepID=A0ABN0H651_9LEPT|nr:protein phosphatase 2C domain-containing protein [Leptospira licerasiae]EIE00702.1 stage II sporulation protein E [Leptospira licerasiae serovar Varillal str. VAR 010]EJZ41031.1 stage II sporulation protein E [Leptospira licerasiae str. MMD4847]TGM88574.1 serine/threonine-protein phosphatase [Leptospira licerasiae]